MLRGDWAGFAHAGVLPEESMSLNRLLLYLTLLLRYTIFAAGQLVPVETVAEVKVESVYSAAVFGI